MKRFLVRCADGTPGHYFSWEAIVEAATEADALAMADDKCSDGRTGSVIRELTDEEH